MTEDEFLKKYHEFMTTDKEEAKNECLKANKLADGFKVVAQEFPGLGFSLMLKTASDYIKGIGIVEVS